MVCHGISKKHMQGSGFIDDLLSEFTYERYPGEHHAISKAPATYGVPMNFMGPNTRLDLRLNADGTPKPDSIPINNADFASYVHDLSYYNAKKDYEKKPTPENRKIQLNKVWKADDKFINEMKYDTEEPMAAVAGALKQRKK